EIKNSLVQELKQQFAAGRRLHIITVESVDRDFNKVESLQGAAGCDVFNCLQENQLTQMITQFVSHTPKGGRFVHINRNKAPVGFVPYGDRYFSEFRVPAF